MPARRRFCAPSQPGRRPQSGSVSGQLLEGRRAQQKHTPFKKERAEPVLRPLLLCRLISCYFFSSAFCSSPVCLPLRIIDSFSTFTEWSVSLSFALMCT